MPDVEIRPFSDERLDAAATLLAERHARHVAAEPVLPRDPDYRAQIAAIGGDGVVALRGGEVRAYLIGERTEDDAFVGFAALETGGATAIPRPGIVVRPGRGEDLDDAARLPNALWGHQHGSPSFSGRTLFSFEEMREHWRGTWDDPSYVHFVAERDGRPVGQILLVGRAEDDLRIPPRSIDLSHASVAPRERNSGVGVALTEYALEWARDEGLRSMTVDWREVNLLASRFWPRRGFRPTFFRLYRHIP